MVSRSRISPTRITFGPGGGGTQGVSKACCVAVKFTLVDGGAFVVVQEFDRIFNGDDVVIFLAIDAIEERGQSG